MVHLQSALKRDCWFAIDDGLADEWRGVFARRPSAKFNNALLFQTKNRQQKTAPKGAVLAQFQKGLG